MLKRLWLDESGAILSSELILLIVILVIGLTVGMVALRDAIVAQYADVALAIGGVDTSFGWDGLSYFESLVGTGALAWVADSLRLATYNIDGAIDITGLTIEPIDQDEAKQGQP
jgi:hypothetical protein